MLCQRLLLAKNTPFKNRKADIKKKEKQNTIYWPTDKKGSPMQIRCLLGKEKNIYLDLLKPIIYPFN